MQGRDELADDRHHAQPVGSEQDEWRFVGRHGGRRSLQGSRRLSIGSDGAGSVRIPAAFCGNFGFKASFGRVPAHPLSPFGTVSHIGPHTMSVTDGALDDERAQAARRPRLDGASPRSVRLPRRPRRGHRRATSRCSRRRSATPRVHPGSRGRRCRGGQAARSARRPRRGGRPRLRRPAADHDGAVVHGRAGRCGTTSRRPSKR